MSRIQYSIVNYYTLDLHNLPILHTWNFVPFNLHLPYFHGPLALEATILLSASKSWTFLHFIYRWNQAAFVSLCLAFSLSVVDLAMLSQMSRFPSFLSPDKYSTVYVHHIFFIHLSVDT